VKRNIIGAILLLLVVASVGGCDLQQTAQQAGDAVAQVGNQVGSALAQGSFKAKIVGLSAALTVVDGTLKANNADLSNKAINTWDTEGWSKVADEVKAKSADAYNSIQAALGSVKDDIAGGKLTDAQTVVATLRKALDDFAATQ
jgi:hypothetical protein